MRVDLFDFELPQSLIALRPARPRDAARLLVVRPPAAGLPLELDDGKIRDLPDLLSPGDVLVVNDTRVIPVRLHGRRVRSAASARIEATLHRREGANIWRAFVRPAKRLTRGEIIAFAADGPESFEATVIEKGDDGDVLLSFSASGSALDAALERIGRMPLPPYISSKRPADESDAGDYQTLFARHSGAIAAPTASLHFTPALVEALAARKIAIATVTLHVGAGTFLPVKAADTEDHQMHAEWGEVSATTAKTLNHAHAAGRRIIAVGTTSLRILETAAAPDGAIAAFSGDTSIFITPGYKFRVVDGLVTNFHLPRSTLFMLVCAFCGLEHMRAAYSHAIEQNYRFYSYGDACLLFPAAPRDGA